MVSVATFHNHDSTHGNPFSRSMGVDGGFAARGQGVEMPVDQCGYSRW